MIGQRALLAMLCASCASATTLISKNSVAQTVTDADQQKRANAVLTLMGISLTPDVTTGSLSISDQNAGNPYFRQSSISGGGTLRSRPLYLEGTLAYGRYDPTFTAGGGGAPQSNPAKGGNPPPAGGGGGGVPPPPHPP